MAAVLVIAGCTAPTSDNGGPANQIGIVPEGVAALAAPGQDLTTARLVPEDRCFWYEHSGPVEKTLVPLRAVNGNQICAARDA